jgi:hypothetical protein
MKERRLLTKTEAGCGSRLRYPVMERTSCRAGVATEALRCQTAYNMTARRFTTDFSFVRLVPC